MNLFLGNGIRETQNPCHYCFDSPYAKPIFIALGIIVMIGGLIATGLLYSSMGPAVLGFSFTGLLLGSVFVALGSCCWRQRGGLDRPLEEQREVEVNLPNQNVFRFQFVYSSIFDPPPIETLPPARESILIPAVTSLALKRAQLTDRQFGMSDLCILDSFRVEYTRRLREYSLMQTRSMGLMLGMAVGDAVGTRYTSLQFRAEGYREHEQRDRLQWEPGQWTGGTAMALCLTDILIRGNCVLNETQLMWSFHDWLLHHYNGSCTRGEYGRLACGLTAEMETPVRAFIESGIRRDNMTQSLPLQFIPTISGESSLLRTGPVAIAAPSLREAMELASRQCKVTDPTAAGEACCRAMANLLYLALHSERRNPEEVREEIVAAYQRLDLSEHRQTTPGRTLALALECISTTDTFEAAIRKAAMRGGNASAVGALTGQLAGAIYGREGIPEGWVSVVERWDHGGSIAARGFELATMN